MEVMGLRDHSVGSVVRPPYLVSASALGCQLRADAPGTTGSVGPSEGENASHVLISTVKVNPGSLLYNDTLLVASSMIMMAICIGIQREKSSHMLGTTQTSIMHGKYSMLVSHSTWTILDRELTKVQSRRSSWRFQT